MHLICVALLVWSVPVFYMWFDFPPLCRHSLEYGAHCLPVALWTLLYKAVIRVHIVQDYTGTNVCTVHEDCRILNKLNSTGVLNTAMELPSHPVHITGTGTYTFVCLEL